ncbi:MAG: type I restriction enzyme HsdR N-terminal domain-containing protein [Pirellulales bacterium]
MAQNIKPKLKKFSRYFNDLRGEKANEANTVARLRHFFEEVLGYDRITEISGESEMKGKYVDLCLKVGGNIFMLVEAKAAAVQLRTRQIDQAKHYASENGYDWVLLTNGVEWNLYHVSYVEEEGIEYTPAFAVSIADENDLNEAAEKLAILHRGAVAKNELDRFWDRKSALCAASLGKAIFHENVLRILRRELRSLCDVLIDPEDLAVAVHNMFSQEARDEMGPLRIRKSKKRKAKPKPEAATAAALSATNGEQEPIRVVTLKT